jgi:GTP cyclohydrolase I
MLYWPKMAARAAARGEACAMTESERRPLRHDHERIAAAVREILWAIGDDPDRPGVEETPDRVARAYAEICWGVGRDPAEEIDAIFDAGHDEMVILRDIPFYSLCEHHLLPFFGRAHVAYIPDGGRITGISKLARAVEVAARRPQVQERLTCQVADAVMRRIEPQGVLVVCEAEHLCMTMRGIRKPGSVAVTSCIRGCFLEDEKTRAEALALINRH